MLTEKRNQYCYKDDRDERPSVLDRRPKNQSHIRDLFLPSAPGKDPRGEFVEQYRREKEELRSAKERAKRSHAGKIFLRVAELVVIGVSFFERSYIVRFLTAKLSMDMLVEITARFGPKAGHQVSSLLAAIVAEPRLIAVIVTGMILFLELLVCLIQILTRGRRRRLPATRDR